MSNRNRYSGGGLSGDGPDDPFGDLPQVDDRICDYVDGCLSPRELERFEAELRVSDRLREQLETYRVTVADVREALNAPIVQVDVADRVMAAIAGGAQPVADPGARPAAGSGRVLPFVMALVSAAALLAIAVWLDAFGTRTAPDVADDVAAETAIEDETGALTTLRENRERAFGRGGMVPPATAPEARDRYGAAQPSAGAPSSVAPDGSSAGEPKPDAAWNSDVAMGSKDEAARDGGRELGKQSEAGGEGATLPVGEHLRQLPEGADPEQAAEEAEAKAAARRAMVVPGGVVDENAKQGGAPTRRTEPSTGQVTGQSTEPSSEGPSVRGPSVRGPSGGRQADAPGEARSQLPSRRRDARSGERQSTGTQPGEPRASESEQPNEEVGIGGGAGARRAAQPRAPTGPADQTPEKAGRGPAGPGRGRPVGPSTGGPTGPSTGGPTGPSTGGPAGPSTGRPTGPRTGGPTGPSTGGPAGPSTGGPAGPSTGRPVGPATGRTADVDERLQGVGDALSEPTGDEDEDVHFGRGARPKRGGVDREVRAGGGDDDREPLYRYRLFSGESVEPDAKQADGAAVRGEQLTQLVFDGVVAPAEERAAFAAALADGAQTEQDQRARVAPSTGGGAARKTDENTDEKTDKSVQSGAAPSPEKAAEHSLLVRRFFVDQMVLGAVPAEPSAVRGSGGGGGTPTVATPVRIGAVLLQPVGPRDAAVGDLLEAERRERHWLIDGPEDEVAAVIRELTSYAQATRRRVSTGYAAVVPGGADLDADAQASTGSDDFFLGRSRRKSDMRAGLDVEAGPTRRLLLRFRPRPR